MKFSSECSVLMSAFEIRQKVALEGQRGGRRGQEGLPTLPNRASWSTVNGHISFGLCIPSIHQELCMTGF